jgi:hypothetical protein
MRISQTFVLYRQMREIIVRKNPTPAGFLSSWLFLLPTLLEEKNIAHCDPRQ